MLRLFKLLLDLLAIDANVKLPVSESNKHIPNNLIDVLRTRKTTRLGWKWASYNKLFSLFEHGNIAVEIITIRQVNNGQISEIIRDCDSPFSGTYETYLRAKGYNVRLNPHEIRNTQTEFPSTQYNWETSGVNVIEIYQQAFLGKVDGKLRIRSIIRYVDITIPLFVKKKTYYHEHVAPLSVKDFMLKAGLFVRNNESGLEYFLNPKINISDDSPRDTILYDSRFPGQSYKELNHLRV